MRMRMGTNFKMRMRMGTDFEMRMETKMFHTNLTAPALWQSLRKF